jgi:pimeloyl-ACP methyl ester carboxylesterase
MTSPLLFLSGAGLPAWIWDDVRAAHPDSSVAAYPKTGTLQDYATKVLAEAPERFVIVAHSAGGVVASQLLAQAPQRVEALLGIAASFPKPGQSFLNALPFPNKLIVGLAMRLAGTKPPEKAIRSGLTGGVDPLQADRIVADFSPESQHLYRDPVPARQFPSHTGYVQTTADKEFPQALQQTYLNNLNPTWTRTIPTGHLPMLTATTPLSLALKEFLEGR